MQAFSHKFHGVELLTVLSVWQSRWWNDWPDPGVVQRTGTRASSTAEWECCARRRSEGTPAIHWQPPRQVCSTAVNCWQYSCMIGVKWHIYPVTGIPIYLCFNGRFPTTSGLANSPGELDETYALCLILAHSLHYVKTWHYPQNRKYVRGGPNHGHR